MSRLSWQAAAPWVLPSATLAVLLALWQSAASAGMLPATVPAPTAIAVELVTNRAIYWYHLVPTALTAISGYLLAIGIALAAALTVHHVRSLELAVLSLGSCIDSIPIIALAPVLTIWMGVALPTRITLAMIICLFPLLATALRGLHAPSDAARALFRVLAASSWQQFRKLTFPAALPYFFHGLKIAAPLAVLGTLVGEWTGAEQGLGVLMTGAMLNLEILQLWGSVCVTCALASLLYGVVALIEYFALRGRPAGEAE